MRTQNPEYTPYHPRWYRRRIPIFWWVHKWVHVRFILRELTSVAVAVYALVMLFQVRALVQGPEAYAAFRAGFQSPVSVVLHVVGLLAVVFHSVTWFNLAPKALVLRLGGKRIPGAVIAGMNYVAWGVFSAAIAWMVLSG